MNKLNLKYPYEIVRNQNHTYTVDGWSVPGVTTVNKLLPKPWQLKWVIGEATKHIGTKWLPECTYPQFLIDQTLEDSKGAWKKKFEGAGDTGTNVHKYIEDYINDGQLPMIEDKEEDNCFRQFIDWGEKFKPTWIATEMVVASKEYGFAGTLDSIAEINGKMCLIDFKTSSGIREEYYIQTAAYQLALEECVPNLIDGGIREPSIVINERWILRMDKTSKNYEFKLVPTPYAQDVLAFTSLLALHKSLVPYRGFLK